MKENKQIFPASFFLWFLLWCVSVQAQKDIVVGEDSLSLKQGVRAGFYVDIPETHPEVVGKALAKYIKGKSKSKVEQQGDLYTIQNTIHETVSLYPMHIYALVGDSKEGTKVSMAFKNQNGFITSTTDAENALSVKKFLRAFGVQAYQYAVDRQVETAQKKLTQLEKQWAVLRKQNDKLQRTAMLNGRTIEKAQEKKAIARQDQASLQKYIQAQKELITKLTGVGDRQEKEARKTLKKLQKELKQAVKTQDKALHRISDVRRDIRVVETEVQKNVEAQKEMKKTVDMHKKAYMAVQKKRENIR